MLRIIIFYKISPQFEIAWDEKHNNSSFALREIRLSKISTVKE